MIQTMYPQAAESEPVSYSVLNLPTKRELRKKGFHVEEVNTNFFREHPLARWTTHPLPRGATYRDALDAIEEANKAAWGLLKARIHFSDGSFDLYVRSNPNDPLTIKNISTYSPHGVYRALTKEKSMESRELLLPRLRPIADARGHHTCKKAIPKTFAPQVLYRNCPPPVHSQAGYDFLPMSHKAFLLRPGDHPKGVRDVKSDFMKGCTDYRPRSYLRDEVINGLNSRHGHCAEVYQVGDYTMDLACATDRVNQRNRVTAKDFTGLGTYVPHRTIVGKRNAKFPSFPCAHQPGATADTRVKESGGSGSPAAEALDPQESANMKSGDQRSVHFEEPTKDVAAEA